LDVHECSLLAVRPILLNVRIVSALPFLVAALALAPAAAAPPSRGVFVPRESLAGVELGMTRAEVRRAWGGRHGVCRDCRRTTWYFNYRPFEPEGAGVVFRRARVSHVFTIWRPRGWRTEGGLELGAPEAEIPGDDVIVEERECLGYTALISPSPEAQTVYYVYRERLWGFGLVRPGDDPCL
jgi:hypothetical protein